MSDFQRGQRVSYAKHILRRDSRPGEFNGPNRIWSSELYPGNETTGGTGIIIGKRTLSNGNSYYGYDEVTVYQAAEHFTAYLIAHDLHRKPVFVRPEHIEATLPVGATATGLDQTPSTTPEARS